MALFHSQSRRHMIRPITNYVTLYQMFWNIYGSQCARYTLIQVLLYGYSVPVSPPQGGLFSFFPHNKYNVGSGTPSTHVPFTPKTLRNFKIFFESYATPKISPFCIFTLRKDPKMNRNLPFVLVQICDDPTKTLSIHKRNDFDFEMFVEPWLLRVL